MLVKRFLLFIALFMSLNVWAENVEFYVSKSGSNHNHGTKEEPVATFDAARNLVRRYLSINDYPKEGITIWVDEGEYFQSKPFVLNENDSGKPNTPIVWRALEKGKVSITGGRSLPVSEFKRIDDKKIKERLTKDAAKNTVCIDLKALGIDQFGEHNQFGHALSVCPAPLELFFNNQPTTLARYPNKGFVQIEKVLDSGSNPR